MSFGDENEEDDIFDNMVSDDPNSLWQQAGTKSLDEIPLFADPEVIAAKAERGELGEDFGALQDLIYNNRDPKEIAEDFKHQGNEKMKHGKIFLTDAIKFYTSALEQPFEDNNLRATLLANRAQANLLKENFGRTINDCTEALKLSTEPNKKVYYRLATAAFALDKYGMAIEACQNGAKISTGNDLASFNKLQKSIEEKVIQEQKRRKEMELLKQKRANVDTRIKELNIIMRQPLLEITRIGGNSKIEIDEETDDLSFPVVFLYDEFSQNDFVQKVLIDDVISEHLRAIFDEAKPEWDVNSDYSFDKVELFTLGRKSTEELSQNDAIKKENSCRRHPHRWIRIGAETTLRKVLAHPSYEMFGIPMFWVISKTTEYRETFIRESPDDRFFVK